jgi:ribosomal protein S18 acetylase RimI-like enzyme
VGVTTWYLEMTDPGQLRPAAGDLPDAEVVRVDPPDPALNRRMYSEVGGPWQWLDRLPWDDERWRAAIERPEIETWVVTERDSTAGYAELERTGDEVEIAYFGLLRGFERRGLGGLLLTAVTRRAWELDPRSVWLHTCSLDSPAALPAYERRGFEIYKTD